MKRQETEETKKETKKKKRKPHRSIEPSMAREASAFECSAETKIPKDEGRNAKRRLLLYAKLRANDTIELNRVYICHLQGLPRFLHRL